MRIIEFVTFAAVAALLAATATASTLRQPYSIVQPVSDHTKLELNEAGLQVLRQIKGRVAPVVVIGPYRSGKSFTLNQLLGVGCDEGFGVGHTRNTQTKGVWVWGEPMAVKDADGNEVNLVFFDTEGFESTGKADVYDDRIFALSTLISSVLVYNLPESIRESDLEKLSFAAELAKAFYSGDTSDATDDSLSKKGGREGREEPAVQPGAMIWLIQRDFLQGDTLTETLRIALRQVPNPHKDSGITQLNKIRQGLSAIAANSTALGLPQPHLERTKLCEMEDSALDTHYVKQRDQLKKLVRSQARPKVVRGAALDGPALATLVSEVVTALNAREIPTAGSLVEYFNRELVSACRDQYVQALEKIALPAEAAALAAAATAAGAVARDKFENERFGSAVEGLRETLQAALDRELSARETANTYESSRACEEAEMECETALEKEASQKLPSTGRFEAKYEQCRKKFDRKCVGPGREHNEERLLKAWEREKSRFNRDYNDRLLNGLVLISLASIVLFRFVVRWTLGESASWAAFLFLQVYPRTFLGSSTSMFETGWWQTLIQGWEAVVNNPIVDVEKWGLPLLAVVAVAYLTRKRWVPWLPARCGRRRVKRGKSHADKDLDV